MSDRPVSVTTVDHVVFTVPDVEVAVAWYRDRLGLVPERLEHWRRGEVPFVSMRIDATTLIDLAAGERSGVNVDHVALVVDDDVEKLASSGAFDLVRGPSRIFGARGIGLGIYVRDPAGNVIELRSYPAD